MELDDSAIGKLVQYYHEGLRVGTVTIVKENTVGIQPIGGRGGKKPHEIFVGKEDVVIILSERRK